MAEQAPDHDSRSGVPAMPASDAERDQMIEIIQRPDFCIGGQRGGFEGRLIQRPSIWGAGRSAEEARLACLRTWASLLK